MYPLLDIKCADTLDSVYLMSADGYHIRMKISRLYRYLHKSLNGIAVRNTLGIKPFYRRKRPLYGVDSSRFVVDEHAGHKESGVIGSGDDFAKLLLEKSLVAVVPGSGFGAPNFVRLSYAISTENIETGMDRLEAFLKQLQ